MNVTALRTSYQARTHHRARLVTTSVTRNTRAARSVFRPIGYDSSMSLRPDNRLRTTANRRARAPLLGLWAASMLLGGCASGPETAPGLDRLMQCGEPPGPLLLDLGAADFIDSSGLSWLLMWHKRYASAGAKLVLHSIPPMVGDVLRMMRLDSVFNIAADEKAARAIA